MIETWKLDLMADVIGRAAEVAMMEEVVTTPKPGLVDLYSNGAHTDMDVDTFHRSATALRPFFTLMAREGMEGSGSPEDLFRSIRKIGIQAEEAMYGATGGVNTHKGVIFTFGIFSAAAGRCLRDGITLGAESLSRMQQAMTTRILHKELARIRGDGETAKATHGERNLRLYGTTGIRGEAIAGYPGIFRIALPVLLDGQRQGKDWNLNKLQTLLTLMAKTEDSNVLSRGGMEELERVQVEAKAFLLAGGAYRPGAEEALRSMDQDYIRRNVSPGGSADLLAAAIFIDALSWLPVGSPQ